MCGICGVYSPSLNEGLVQQMLALLGHRGPDNATVQSSSDKNVTFGHSRLSLLDPSARGNQPFQNERALLVFNGEIYNFLTLKKELLEKGFTFSTGTDTEVLFYLLLECGIEKTVERLRGMFAFAFYDLETKELTLARDRLGIKPLFFSRQKDTLLFSSELKAILLADGNYPVLEHAVLRSAFGHMERSRGKTSFAGIEQLEPGSFMTFSQGRGVTTRYFRTSQLLDPTLHGTLTALSDEEVDQQFREILARSVETMLIADASIGAFVSGGLDSSVIASLITDAGKKASLYSLNISGRYSEIESARALARHLGAELNEYEFLPHYFLRDWVDATYFYESPIIVNQHAVPFGSIAQVAREKGEKAVLTGEGADELLLGYSPHIRTWTKESLFHYFSPLRGVITRRPRALKAISSLRALPDELEDVYMGGDESEREREYREATSFLPTELERTMHTWSLRLLDSTLQALLWRNDRMGMMHSVESRFPFLDEEVVRFCLSLPLRHKIRLSAKGFDKRNPGVVGKAILRRAFEKRLPRNHTYLLKRPLPVHGMTDLDVASSLFEEGFWQELLREPHLNKTLESSSRGIRQRMAAIEVWGRLFVLKQSREEVKALVSSHCRMSL